MIGISLFAFQNDSGKGELTPADTVTSSDSQSMTDTDIQAEIQTESDSESSYSIAVSASAENDSESDGSAVISPLSYDIFSASDEELTFCWENADLSQNEIAKLTTALRLFDAEEYHVSFFLYDLNSGQGFSYHSDDSYYSASTIKGTYIVYIAQTFPEDIYEQQDAIEDTILFSDNNAYDYLWNIYGTDSFSEWVNDAGCETIDVSEPYADITSRDLALMWIKMYRYFSSDTPDSEWISVLYTNTLNSCIGEALGDTCTVYSKAGWINEDDYYNVQNDAGIVMAEGHPYVLVVLSTAYDCMDLLKNLIYTIDDIHSALTETE